MSLCTKTSPRLIEFKNEKQTSVLMRAGELDLTGQLFVNQWSTNVCNSLNRDYV